MKIKQLNPLQTPANGQKKRVPGAALLLLLTLGLSACGSPTELVEQRVITVTIEPLRYFTEQLAGNRFAVVSMVPDGSSPETYDPTPQQLVQLARSEAYLRTGYIGFEQVWMDKLTANAPHMQVFDTSQGIDLLRVEAHTHAHADATHAHDGDGHAHAAGKHGEHGHTHGDPHRDGHQHPAQAGGDESHDGHTPAEGTARQVIPALEVEPHIWSSAANARIMVRNICQALCTIDSAYCAVYERRRDSLNTVIDRTDSIVRALLAGSDTRAFLIYHPALSYYARDYGLRQYCIEDNGKEPSPAHLQRLIRTCRDEHIPVVFVQKEFDSRNASVIAGETGTRVVTINPLSYDWAGELIRITQALVNHE